MLDKIKEVIEQSKEQLSIKQISDMTGISRSSVKRYCEQLNYIPKRHEAWNKNLTKEENESLNNISKTLSGRKLASRSKETKQKISFTMKNNSISGGHRIGSGRGQKYNYKDIQIYTEMSLGVAKSLDYEKVDWTKPETLFSYINEENKLVQTHLDFYLPKYDLYLSVKEFDNVKIRRTMKRIEDYNDIKVIVIGSFLYHRIKYLSIENIIKNMLKNKQ